MEKDIEISIIVTCKNRLSHLKKTIKNLQSQSNSELIVVDYDCQENTSGWVKSNYPSAKTLVIKDDQIFSLSRARNLGANIAQGNILLFVDADRNDVQYHEYERRWKIYQQLLNRYLIAQLLKDG